MGLYDNQYFRANTYMQPAAQQNGILWVQGESGAKSWMMAPNSTVLLMDSENPVMYIKSTDISGMPSMRVFDYTERAATEAHTGALQIKAEDYCTREDLARISAKCDAIEAMVTEMAKKGKKVNVDE